MSGEIIAILAVGVALAGLILTSNREPQLAKGRESRGEAIMKPINCLVMATVAVVFVAPVQAQVDCANWNTSDFFKATEVSDMTRCLQAGADPNARTGNGQTPLHFAAGNGTAEAVATLLNAGADPNARTVVGNTPLHFAEHAEPVAALLEAGADPAARDTNCKLPFDYAADNEQLKGTDVYWKLNDARFQSSGSSGGIGGGVFRVGCGVSAPQVLFKVDPAYTEQARKAKLEGTVVLNLVVQRDGSVRNVRVVQSLDLGLNEKAIEAVQKWRFRPGMKNGEPVDVAAIIEVTFRLL